MALIVFASVYALVVGFALALAAAAGRAEKQARVWPTARPASAMPRGGMGMTVVATLALSASGPVPAPAQASGERSCRGADSAPRELGPRRAEAATLCLINHERARRDRRPLEAHHALSRAATRHSRDMAAREYFAHETLGGGGSLSSRIVAARYTSRRDPWKLGENLAWGTGRLATPAAIVEAWLASPKHEATMLSRSFEDIGIGIAQDGAKTIYTTDFGALG